MFFWLSQFEILQSQISGLLFNSQIWEKQFQRILKFFLISHIKLACHFVLVSFARFIVNIPSQSFLKPLQDSPIIIIETQSNSKDIISPFSGSTSQASDSPISIKETRHIGFVYFSYHQYVL